MLEFTKKIGLRLLSVLLALALAGLAVRYIPEHQSPKRQNTISEKPQAKAIDPQPFGHPYYRYSVIPGGAYSAAELQSAIGQDSVVASHYSDFNVAQTRVLTLDNDKLLYSSYRIGDKIFWTQHPLKLLKGETLLTDGIHLARTRCGNRLIEKLSSTASKSKDPGEKIFNAPVAVLTPWTRKVLELEPGPHLPFDLLSSRVSDMPEPLENLAKLSLPDPPDEAFTRDYIPTPTEHEKPPIAVSDGVADPAIFPVSYPQGTPPVSGVPEPGTAALGGIALIAVALLGRRFRKQP